VGNYTSNNVTVINAATNTVVATIAVGTHPNNISINPDGTKVYVTNQGSNSVSVITTATNTVTASIAVGSAPNGVTITPDGTKAYVANYGSNTVSVITTATNIVAATVAVGTAPLAFGSFMANIVTPCAPTISSFTSTSAAGGTVSIIGTNFTGATAVSFGGVAAASFTVVNATTITAVVGSGASGSVSVTTLGGTASLLGFTCQSLK
jgi:YVTN family beta-propeller protein